MFSPIRNLIILLMILPVQAYRVAISPFIGARCRFTPTCSEYALDAIRLHGPLKGGYLSARRILKCHPFGASGYDAVPEIRGPEVRGHEIRGPEIRGRANSGTKKIPLDR